MIRSFVGLPLDSASRNALGAWRENFGDSHSRFVPPENYHLTLAFLGNQEASDLRILGEELQELAASSPAFGLVFQGFGSFRARRGSTVYAAVKEPPEELFHLARKVRAALDRLALDFDRKALRPHVTLARNVRTFDPVRVVPGQNVRAQISELVVFRSDQTAQGVRYSRMTQGTFAMKENQS